MTTYARFLGDFVPDCAGFADLLRALIRSDVRQGVQEPLASGVVWADQERGNRLTFLISPEMVNRHRKADCAAILRAECGAPQDGTPITHVAVLRGEQGETYHCFGVALPAGESDACTVLSQALRNGDPGGVVRDPCAVRSMNPLDRATYARAANPATGCLRSLWDETVPCPGIANETQRARAAQHYREGLGTVETTASQWVQGYNGTWKAPDGNTYPVSVPAHTRGAAVRATFLSGPYAGQVTTATVMPGDTAATYTGAPWVPHHTYEPQGRTWRTAPARALPRHFPTDEHGRPLIPGVSTRNGGTEVFDGSTWVTNRSSVMGRAPSGEIRQRVRGPDGLVREIGVSSPATIVYVAGPPSAADLLAPVPNPSAGSVAYTPPSQQPDGSWVYGHLTAPPGFVFNASVPQWVRNTPIPPVVDMNLLPGGYTVLWDMPTDGAIVPTVPSGNDPSGILAQLQSLGIFGSAGTAPPDPFAGMAPGFTDPFAGGAPGGDGGDGMGDPFATLDLPSFGDGGLMGPGELQSAVDAYNPGCGGSCGGR